MSFFMSILLYFLFFVDIVIMSGYDDRRKTTYEVN